MALEDAGGGCPRQRLGVAWHALERGHGLRAGPRAAGRKHWLVRLTELAAGCGLTIGLGRFLEATHGQAAPQGWEFYAAVFFLFLTLAFPGFVWRYLQRH